MPRAKLIPLVLSIFCSGLLAQGPSNYYETIQKSAKTHIPAVEFRGIETKGYTSFSDKNTYMTLSNAFLNTSEKVWSIVYAEIYFNLDHSSDTSKSFSRRIADLLQNSMTKTPEADGKFSISISLTKTVETPAGDPTLFESPFENNFEISFLIAVSTDSTNCFPFSLASLSKARNTQMEIWIEKELPKNEYINHLLSIKAAGHFEAYNYLLFSSAFPKEFGEWKSSHTCLIENYQKWVVRNPFTVKSNNFHRFHTVKGS